jgi:hypothetical protein
MKEDLILVPSLGRRIDWGMLNDKQKGRIREELRLQRLLPKPSEAVMPTAEDLQFQRKQYSNKGAYRR